MRSLFAVLRQLVLPAGAGGSAPRIVLGPDVPAPLTTIPNFTPGAAILFYFDATQFYFECSGTWTVIPTPMVIKGTYDTINGITVYDVYRPNFLEASWGSNVFDSNHPFVVMRDVDFSIEPTSGFFIDSVSAPRELLSSINHTNNGTVVTTPAGGAETAVPTAQWDTEPNLSWRNGGLWRVFVSGFTIESTGAGGIVSLVRLRKGQATVAGTQLGLAEVFHPAGFGGLTQSFAFPFYFKNTSGSAVTTRLSLTIQGVFGAGTVSLYGDANMALRIEVQDVGNVADHADLAADAASL